MVSLREASPEDAAVMAHIQSASLRENGEEYYTDEQLAHLAPAEPDAETIPEDEFTDDSCRPIIAELDGEIVGWGSIYLNENVLAATFVDPDYTGQGTGRAIVEKLEAIARQEDVEELTVPASLNAVGFYETLGYKKQREIDASDPDTPEIPSVELTKQLS
jgi:putative acetyltransferase